MPIYEYICEQCRKTIEEYQSIKDDPLTKCKKCGGRLKKQIGSLANICTKSKWTAVRVTKNETIKQAYEKGHFIDLNNNIRYNQNSSTNYKKKYIRYKSEKSNVVIKNKEK